MAREDDGVIERLPRLAVAVEFPIVRSAGGALLLHRLLGGYPPDRLLICDADPTPDAPGRPPGLDGVRYVHRPSRWPRWAMKRINPAWPLFAAASIERQTAPLLEDLERFRPEAILTVPHGYYWLAAAAAARRLRLPLHLIYHDDWPDHITLKRTGLIGRALRAGCRRMLGRVYRQAATRLCVSPGMEEYCREVYGPAGQVLYPSRGPDSPAARVRVAPDSGPRPAVLAYTGTLHHPGVRDMLRGLAPGLAERGGRVDIYSPHDAHFFTEHGLDRPGLRHVGFFPASELAEKIAGTASALLLPASFDPREVLDTATLFPSKLADYTAIGLPILLWGPGYSSAARWATANPEAALAILDPSPAPVLAALDGLLADPARSEALARAAIAAGDRYFALESVRDAFYEAIVAPIESPRPTPVAG